MIYVFAIKSSFRYTSVFALACLLFFSCQRELSPDAQAVSNGVLSKDNNGNCEPILVAGSYYINQNLTDSNYLEADINITSPGLYNITTDTINGFYFTANGVFTNTGEAHIKLNAFGEPLAAGTSFFTIQYNGTTCEASVIIIDTIIHAATFTLAGAPDACMNDSVYGSYIKDVALDTNAKAKVNVNVTKTGTYIIITNIVNGYSFAASGAFTQTGTQYVLLTATGTPAKEETDIFSVDDGRQVCNFSVDVLTAVSAAGNDHFPLSANTYQTYDDLVNIGDTIKETVIDSTSLNDFFYKVVNEQVHFGGPYQYFYRKTGDDYFEYAAPNKYTTFFQYKKPVYADIPFLKENLTTNATWESPEYIDTSSDNEIISLKYDFTCLNANASVTVNGKAFANVYIIKMLPLIKQTDAYAYTNEAYIFYYAKGIGLIYLKKTLSDFTQKEMQIRNWLVY